MTKQEIREGLGTWLSYFKEDKQGLTVDDGVNWILGFLHSQGIRLPDGSSLIKELDTS